MQNWSPRHPVSRAHVENTEIPHSPVSGEDGHIAETEEGEIGDKLLSHKQYMAKHTEMLQEIIAGDPWLHSLHPWLTTEEINSEIAPEHGQAMQVLVKRADGEVMPVVVLQAGAVIDLKNAMKRHFSLKQSREGILKKVSWR